MDDEPPSTIGGKDEILAALSKNHRELSAALANLSDIFDRGFARIHASITRIESRLEAVRDDLQTYGNSVREFGE